MTNMSYCAFENTVDDMNQCIEKLKEHDYDLDYLKKSFSNVDHYEVVQFIKLCKEVSDNSQEVAENTYEGE